MRAGRHLRNSNGFAARIRLGTAALRSIVGSAKGGSANFGRRCTAAALSGAVVDFLVLYPYSSAPARP